jgi:hypothetical protein
LAGANVIGVVLNDARDAPKVRLPRRGHPA